jgi:ubiquinone/menaquinone biosynthesis C-methylase UbiE
MQFPTDAANLPLYSLAQMDNFYAAFAAGHIKPTSVMNYLQHLFIAERCRPGDWVLDVCCGRALQVPILRHLASSLGGYVGVDISQEHLEEAQVVLRYGDGNPPPFPCEFFLGDATCDLTRLNRLFHVVIYTSALEHMEKAAGIASLRQVAQVLHPEGTFYLSTPRTAGPPPRTLQHRVHIYEWDKEELEEELARLGFRVLTCAGLLPPEPALLVAALQERFGPGAVSWFEQMQQLIPHPFFSSLCAVALPEIATELLYVCRRGRAGDSPVEEHRKDEIS